MPYVCVVISSDPLITLRSGHKYSQLETKIDTGELILRVIKLINHRKKNA